MEFLGIYLTKDSSVLLHAIHSHIYRWFFLKKSIVCYDFKNPYKRSAKQKNSILSMNSIL
jgi:hypothetical protein